jgi:DNA-binding MarR family transcriptional regulator
MTKVKNMTDLTIKQPAEIVKQNDLIISLLGRMAFENDELKALVIKGSHKPEEILSAYNLCNGQTTITSIAKEVGIAQPSLTEAVKRWEDLGIVIKKSKGNEVLPLRLFEIR